MTKVIKVLNLTLALILVGVTVVVWFGFNPSGLSGSAYIERQQAMIRLLNTPMPLLGATTIFLTFVSPYLRRENRATAIFLIMAGILLIGAGVVTRCCNQPINAVVMTWNAGAPPANWESLRDEWWR